jgi:hypothetical protein
MGMWLNGLQRLFQDGRGSRRATKHPQRPRHSRRPAIEQLETRLTPASTLSISGGVLTFSAIAGKTNVLTVSVSGSTYTFNDTGDTITLSGVTGTGSGGNTVTVSRITNTFSSIALNTDDLNDTVNIRSILDPTVVNGGAGNDTINVSSNASSNTGNLLGIKAGLTVNADAGADTLNVSNFGGAAANSMTVSANSITGDAFGVGGLVTYNDAANAGAAGSFNLVHYLGSNSPTATDTITVAGTSSPFQVDGEGGSDVLNVQGTGAFAATINGNAGDDTINVSSDAPTNQGNLNGIGAALTIDAGAGAGNQLFISDFGETTTPNSNIGINTTTITGLAGPTNASTITYRATGGSYANVTVSGSNTLADTFNINQTARVNLQGNGGDDAFNFSTATVAILNGNIDGGAGNDTITGDNVGRRYTVNAVNGGTISTILSGTFSNVENLTGGTGDDVFTFTAGGSVAGAITGAAGSDTLNVGGDVTLTTSTANGYSGTNANIGGGFSGIDTLNGSGTLTGENVASTWTLGATATYQDNTANVLTFSGYSTLQGGTAVDAFTVTAAGYSATLNGGAGNDTFVVNGTLTGSISGQANDDTISVNATVTGVVDGGAGSDTLNVGGDVTLTTSTANGYSGTNANIGGGFSGINTLNGTGTLTGENTASTWSLNGASATYDDQTGVAPPLAFAGYSTLQGGTGVDAFTVAVAGYTATLNGGAGNDTFVVNGTLTGSISGQANDDTISVNATVTGVVDGGAGSDTLNVGGDVTLTTSTANGYSGTNSNIGGGFSGIDTLNGSGTLTGENVASTWTLGATATYQDNTANVLTFSGYSTLQGGTAVDAFTVTAAGYSATLNGGDGNDTFVVNGTLTGSINGQNNDDSITVNASVTGVVDGGAGSDTLNIIGDVTLTGSTATGYAGTNANIGGGFLGIDVLNGDGVSTLTGENVDSTWSLGATATYKDNTANVLTISAFGSLQGGTGVDAFTVALAGFTANLLGGDGNDTFLVNGVLTGSISGQNNDDSITITTGSVTGAVDGGTGSDTLSVPGDVTLTTSTANGYSGTNGNIGGGFSGIDTLNGSGTLTGENVASTWTLGATATYQDNTANVLTFSGYSTLQGGTAVDAFTVTAAGYSATLNGGDGNDTFVVNGTLTGSINGQNNDDSITVNASVTGVVDGGAGSDTLNLGGDVTLTTSTANGYSGTNANIGGGFSGIDTLIGSGTLTGENVASTWTLGATATYQDNTANVLTFSGYSTLQGGTAVDAFTVTAAGYTATLLGGDGNDTFALNGILTGSIDGQAGSDTITGDNTGRTFNVNSTNGGAISVILTGTFANVENLTGGSGDDSFVLADGIGLTGSIDGGAGSDTLSYAAYTTTVLVTLSGSDANGFSSASATNLAGFAGINTLIGGDPNDALTGENTTNTWTLGATQTYNDGTNTLTFSGFETLNGGSGVDTFLVQSLSAPITLNGNGGADVFTVSSATSTVDTISAALVISGGGQAGDVVTVSDTGNATGKQVTIDGGSVSSTTSGSFFAAGGSLAYGGVANLTVLGGSGNDTFDVTPATAPGTVISVDGGDPTTPPGDTLIYEANGGATSDVIIGGVHHIQQPGKEDVIYSNFETVNIANGVITLNGTTGDDTLVVTGTSATDGSYVLTLNGVAGPTVNFTNLQGLVFNALGGNDEMDINNPAGTRLSPTPGAFDFEAGTGTDVLKLSGGAGTSETYTITGVGTGNIATGPAVVQTVVFTGLENVSDTVTVTDLTVDTTALSGAGITLADGASGFNDVNVAGDLGYTFQNKTNVTVSAGSGGDTFNLSSTAAATGLSTVTLNGNAGNDVFNILASTPAGVTTNLNGGANNDSFVFTDATVLTGSIDGGSETDTLDYSAYSSSVSVNLQTSVATGISGTFSNIENALGGTVSDTLTGADVANTWTISGSNTGDVNGFTFASFENLNGGTSTDNFVFGAAGSESGTVDGGAGVDTLDWSAQATGVAASLSAYGGINGFNGSAPGVVGAFANIDSLVGTNTTDSLTDTVTTDPASWSITGANSGSLTQGSGPATLAFSGFPSLAGSSENDTFQFANGGSLAGTIDGGGGSNTIVGDNLSDAFQITGGDAGSIGTILAAGFVNVGNLTGGTGGDTFTFGASGTLSGNIVGGLGNDTIVGNDAGHTYTVNAANGGTISDILVGTFSGVENLTGGTGADSFLFVTGGTLSGTIDGGTGAGLNTLTGDNAGDTFNVTGANSGNIAGVLGAFVNVQNLVGGTSDDSFVFGTGGSLSGTIDGGTTSTGNSITGDNANHTFDITGANAGAIDVILAAGFTNVQNLVGGTANDTFQFENAGSLTGSVNGGAGSNTIKGPPDVSAVFHIRALDAGTVDSLMASFSNVGNLVGGTSPDTFLMGDATAHAGTAALSGSIDGGTGGGDTLDYSNFDTVTGTPVDVILSGSAANGTDGFTSSSATGIALNFTNISILFGNAASATSTLTGEDVGSTWLLGPVQNYIDVGGNANALLFGGFQILNGGSGIDDFFVTNTTLGTPLALNGNGGDDNFGVSSFATIQGDFSVDGGTGNNSLTANDGGSSASVFLTIEATDIIREGSGIVSYANMGGVDVTSSSGDDNIDIESTLVGTFVTFTAGGGTNDIEIAQVGGNLDAIAGDLTLNLAGGGTNTVVVHDEFSSYAGTAYTVLDSQVARDATTGGGLSINIGFTGPAATLVVLGGSGGSNAFDVTASASTEFWLDGGSGSGNTLNYNNANGGNGQDDGVGDIIDTTGNNKDVHYSDFATVTIV